MPVYCLHTCVHGVCVAVCVCVCVRVCVLEVAKRVHGLMCIGFILSIITGG